MFQERAQAAEQRAPAFVLVDAKGGERATLRLAKDDSPRLCFLDGNGKTRIEIGLKGTEPVVILKDGNEQHRAGIAIDTSNQPHLILSDEKQKPRLHLSVSKEGAPALLMIHADGNQAAGLGIHADGRPWLRPAPATSQPSQGR